MGPSTLLQVKLYIGMTPMQRKWYKDLLNRDVGNLNTLGGPDKMRLLNILMQLRKVIHLERATTGRFFFFMSPLIRGAKIADALYLRR